MLTKDLLVFKNQSTRIIPGFIDPEDTQALQLAENLLHVFEQGIGKTREEIEAEAELYIQGHQQLKLAKGLYKTLLDNAVFSLAAEDAHSRRSAILAAANQAMLGKDCENKDSLGQAAISLADYRQYVSQLCEDILDQPLYPDLPAFEQLQKLKPFNPTRLLQRYNMSLVQSLLLTAQSLTFTTEETSAANLRRIFKCLKFFRLLASITQRNGKTRVVIDGPLSILEGSKKYGLQIASFFPVICLLNEWEISAKVKPKRAIKTLKLDQRSGLLSHYQHMSAFVPEEVKLFAKHFADSVDDWQFIADTPSIKRPKGRLIFPDFTLQHSSGVIVYLEIFHRWHRGPLLERMEEINRIKEPFILAIDRFLLKSSSNDQWQDSLEELGEQQHFLFSDYPSVTRLQKTLDKFLAQTDT